MARPVFVYTDDYLGYRFSATHPLKQVRLQMVNRLLEAYGFFENGHCDLIEPTRATVDDLLSVHTSNYLTALRDISCGNSNCDAQAYGLGAGDNPAFPGMYDATLLYVGATRSAVDRITSGENSHSFNSSGGLHHAMPSRAAGFCLANDCAVALKKLAFEGRRVAYIDIDAHHGDGVQHIFYSDPDVLTISLHETPETLFPRVTGFVKEIGNGRGTGYNVNVPMLAGSTDEHYRFAFDNIVNPLISAFKPAAIVLQVGADGHYEDPLAHLALTSYGWLDMVHQVIGYGLPIISLGGGGYNLATVTRLWTLLSAALADVEIPDEIPSRFVEQYGLTNLHDRTKPDIPRHKVEECWKNVHYIVDELHGTVFPFHGI